jgi:hypothetical protein
MISTSYLRRLPPPEYKHASKARLDYKVKQKVEHKSEQAGTNSSKDVLAIVVGNMIANTR